MGNSPSGLEHDSESEEEEEEELAEGVGGEDEDEAVSVKAEPRNAPHSRALPSRTGNGSSRHASGTPHDAEASEASEALRGTHSTQHPRGTQSWQIESPSKSEAGSSRWNAGEERGLGLASPQRHEAATRGRSHKAGGGDRGEGTVTGMSAGVMVQQEPEGSPFRQQSSQPPLEPQQHGPPAFALPQAYHAAGSGEASTPKQADTGSTQATGHRSRHADPARTNEAANNKEGLGFSDGAARSDASGHARGHADQAGTERGSSGNAGINPSSSRGSTMSTTGSHSFGRITTELLLAAASSLSSHPFLHRPFTLPHDLVTEFYIIRHGEASHNVSSLIGGRSHDAPLTELGEQQAVVLGKFLRSYTSLEFDAIYTSPIERSLRTAHIVCRELGVPPSGVQVADALQELSQGTWEQQPRKSIYKEGVLERMTAAQPDFRAPGGESQRQVEFRMVEFLNSVLFSRLHMALGDNSVWAPPIPAKSFSLAEDGGVLDAKSWQTVQESSAREMRSEEDREGRAYQEQNTAGSSRGQTPPETKSVFRIAVFSHGTAIRCLLRGVMSWDPHLTHKVVIDNTSITLLKHSVSRGWHLVKVNDTAHLLLARGPLHPPM